MTAVTRPASHNRLTMPPLSALAVTKSRSPGSLHHLRPLPTVPLVADLSILLSGGHLLRGVEALVRHLSGVVEAAPTNGPTSYAASTTLQALMQIGLQGASGGPCALTPLLLLRGKDADRGERRDTTGGGQAAAGQAAAEPVGLRSAASLAVALSKLLRRCEGRLVEALVQCSRAQDAVGHPDWAMQLLFLVDDVASIREGQELLVLGAAVGNGGAGEEREEEEEDAAGAAVGIAADSGTVRCTAGGQQVNQQEQQQRKQSEEEEEKRERKEGAEEVEQWLLGELQEGAEEAGRHVVRVCAYAAWRWLPALASLAQRAAAVGVVPQDLEHGAMLVWRPLLLWVRRLCLGYLFVCEGQAAGGEDDGGSSGAAAGEACSPDAAASAGEAGAGAAAAGRPCAVSACGRGGGVRWCGCWRDFLLRDVGVVEVLGTALRQVVPAARAAPQEDAGGAQKLLTLLAEACVLLAAAFPEDVGRMAWGPPPPAVGGLGRGRRRGGAAGDGGGRSSSSKGRSGASAATSVWHPDSLAQLAEGLGGWEGGGPVLRALRVL